MGSSASLAAHNLRLRTVRGWRGEARLGFRGMFSFWHKHWTLQMSWVIIFYRYSTLFDHYTVKKNPSFRSPGTWYWYEVVPVSETGQISLIWKLRCLPRFALPAATHEQGRNQPYNAGQLDPKRGDSTCFWHSFLTSAPASLDQVRLCSSCVNT